MREGMVDGAAIRTAAESDSTHEAARTKKRREKQNENKSIVCSFVPFFPFPRSQLHAVINTLHMHTSSPIYITAVRPLSHNMRFETM